MFEFLYWRRIDMNVTSNPASDPAVNRPPASALRVGVTPWNHAVRSAGLDASFAGQAEQADRMGFHSLWLPEHHFSGPGSIPAPMLLLAAAAARTQRIRLATTSYLLTVRHPIHAAAEVAVLDQISGGRVILGLGRGFQRSLFEGFGVSSSGKRERFEEVLASMQRAWRGEALGSSAGPDEETRLSPLPVQRPHPPLWLAAFGPKAVEQAGRLGLPYLASPIEPLERLAENYSQHRAAAMAAHGTEVAEVPIIRSVFVSSNEAAEARVRLGLKRQAAGLAKARPARLRRLADGDTDDWAIVGSVAAVEERIARYREELGMTHLIASARVPGAEDHEVQGTLEELGRLFL
ncbi:LLM class flavin-dependent oxidoreductase [Myxococcota bacterium]|nr:LLM class flavin-dependent oxidoreductase [Myxococcota bacterium]